MNYLSTKAMTEIMLHDFAKHVQPKFSNRTRFYKYLVVADNDVEVHTVAVKCSKQGQAVKEVVRASVNDPFIYLRDIVFKHIAGYVVDWSREGIGPVQGWGYNGEWASEAYDRSSSLWKLQRPVINVEVLQQSERFRYCSWNPDCGDILDYLKDYVQHPRIELLAKLGAGRFASRIGFVRQLEQDKKLTRFFQQNLGEITSDGYGADVVLMAHRRSIPLAEASARLNDRRVFRGYALPRSIDATRVLVYLQGRSKADYCRYLHNCMALGLDISDTKVAFPKRFRVRAAIVADQMAEIQRRKDAAAAKEQDTAIAACAARYAKLENARGAFAVVLPRRTADLIREGKQLANCLGQGHYAAKMARGETLVAFIRRVRKPRASFVAVEYSPDQKRVLQCYGAKNSRPDRAVRRFVERLFSRKTLRLAAKGVAQ